MGLSLTDFEHRPPFDGDYAAALAEAQQRLGRLQLRQVAHGGRAIILVEGWHASGKRQALRLLAGSFDPCRVSAHCIDTGDADGGRHWLAPYWSRLPHAGETAMFLRGWYGRPVDARACGELADKDWARAFDEINEFEAQQTDHGTILAKLFFHVCERVQARRLSERAADPWLRWTLAGDSRSTAHRKDQCAAWEAMFARSNTRWAGWTIIDADDERGAHLAALTTVAEALEAALPAEAPATKNVVRIASGQAV